MDSSAPKTVRSSEAMIAQVVFPRVTNELGYATAGLIMKLIDIGASLAAKQHSPGKTVTVALDRMDFIHEVTVWEVIKVTSRVTAVWTSSMEIEVVVETKDYATGQEWLVAKGYLVFVCLDKETSKPKKVPELVLETDEERAVAQAAEKRKQSRLEEKRQGNAAHIWIDKTDAPERVARTMTPDDANIYHNVFGGAILELIHQASEKAAFRYVNGPVVSVRQDRMVFEQPAYIGEEVQANAVITGAWRTSMEVQVDVTAKDHKTGEERHIASSYLVFVAQDEGGKPKVVPTFEPKSDKQKQRWEQAQQRRAMRLEDRQSKTL